jgi:acyl dehydratase
MTYMRFEDFAVGQSFTASITITKSDFDGYMAFARTRNILHKNPELAEKEGIKGIMLPGRSIIARAEGEMTRLPAFSDHIMLLYGMDGILAGAAGIQGSWVRSMQAIRLK